jgi:hypothetical protein
MKNIIELNLYTQDNSVSRRTVNVKKLCHSRHSGRDVDAIRKILDKKRAEGYSVHGNPSICRTSRYLLTNEDVIEVQGSQTSGEVEIVVIVDKDDVLISVGSDHNDRSLETLWTETHGKIFDTSKSKQMVPAVLAKDAWRYDDVKDHWDRLNLRSSVTVFKEEIPYQNFTLSNLIDLEYHFTANPWLKEEGVVLFGGSSSILPTVPPYIYQGQSTLTGIVFPSSFNFQVHDPVLNRTISHSYKIISLNEPML